MYFGGTLIVHVDMQDNHVHMQHKYVIMPHTYVEMQENKNRWYSQKFKNIASSMLCAIYLW
jgi:hypothetical protein